MAKRKANTSSSAQVTNLSSATAPVPSRNRASGKSTAASALAEQPLDVWQRLLLIRASAGSGKTHQLSTRLLGYLLGDAPLDSILAVTFTRKAAGEIRDRVFTRLARACLDAKSYRDLMDDLKSGPAASSAESWDAAKLTRKLSEMVQNQNRLSILTLDSFYSQLARCYGFELKLPSGWRVSEPFEEEILRRDAIRATIEALDTQQLQTWMHMLSKDELRTQLTSELDRTAQECYGVFQVAPEAAWDEPHVSERPDDGLVTASIERLANNQFRTAKAAETFRKLAKLASEGAWVDLAAEKLLLNLHAGIEKFGNAKLDDPELVAAARVLLDGARSAWLNQLRMQTRATRDILAWYDGQLRRIKQQRRLVGFDDLTQSLAAFLERHSDADGGLPPRLLRRLDASIEHILLDEFQDTAPMQWRVIEPFVRTALRESGSLFCVGDTKQAIYGWRGGRADLFDALVDRVKGLQSGNLAHSFRSSQVVIDAVNRCFTRLTQHPALDRSADAVCDFVERFPIHSTKREMPGHVVLETAAAEEEASDETLNPCLRRAMDVVEDWHATRPRCEIAILTRTNKPIGILIAHLRKRGIVASQEGGNPLIDSAAVELILSALQLADHPTDSVAAFHLAQSPLAKRVGLPERSVAEVAKGLRERLAHEGLGNTVAWLAEPLIEPASPHDRGRLEQLMELADDFEPSLSVRSGAFLQFVESQRVALPSAVRVRVMTIHMAKGLQFDAVVLPELNVDLMGQPDLLVTQTLECVQPPQAVIRSCKSDQRPFLSDKWQQAYAQADHARTTGALCMAYVAMTRAKQALHLIVPTYSKHPPEHKKLAALLVNALMDEQADCTRPGAILYEAGDRDWRMPGASTTASDIAEPTDDPLSEAPGPLPTPSQPLQIDLRPSQRAARAKPPSRLTPRPERFVSELLDPNRRAGEAVGQLLHRWLADVEWLKDHPLDTRQLERSAASLPSHVLKWIELGEWIPRFSAWMRAPAIAELFDPNRYAAWQTGGKRMQLQVRREMLLSGMVDGINVQGRADRLVIGLHAGQPHHVEILEFKSDALPDDPVDSDAALERLVDRHRDQLETYRQLAANQLRMNDDAISMTLVFLGQQRVIPIAPR